MINSFKLNKKKEIQDRKTQLEHNLRLMRSERLSKRATESKKLVCKTNSNDSTQSSSIEHLLPQTPQQKKQKRLIPYKKLICLLLLNISCMVIPRINTISMSDIGVNNIVITNGALICGEVIAGVLMYWVNEKIPRKKTLIIMYSVLVGLGGLLIFISLVTDFDKTRWINLGIVFLIEIVNSINWICTTMFTSKNMFCF